MGTERDRMKKKPEEGECTTTRIRLVLLLLDVRNKHSAARHSIAAQGKARHGTARHRTALRCVAGLYIDGVDLSWACTVIQHRVVFVMYKPGVCSSTGTWY